MSLLWPIAATLIASSGALAGSGLVLWLQHARPADEAPRTLAALLALAVGTLLGASILDLLPHALEHAEARRVMGRFLLGIFGFFAFERLVRWRHPHHAHVQHRDHVHHPQPLALAAPLILWSDALHNLLDGFVIGTAFTGGVPPGISTTLAVLLHEIPQEVGDFAVLLAAGMHWRRAFLLNWLVQLPPVVAAAASYLVGERVEGAVGWLLPIAAGSLLYIALADLVPSLHHRARGRAAWLQLALVAAGAGVIFALGALH